MTLALGKTNMNKMLLTLVIAIASGGCAVPVVITPGTYVEPGAPDCSLTLKADGTGELTFPVDPSDSGNITTTPLTWRVDGNHLHHSMQGSPKAVVGKIRNVTEDSFEIEATRKPMSGETAGWVRWTKVK